MLVVSPLRSNKDGYNRQGGPMEGNFSMGGDDLPDFSSGNLLDSIDFDDLFMGMQDNDVLPDLEMDLELLAEFSLSGGEGSEVNNNNSGISVESNPNDDGNVVVAVDDREGNNHMDIIVKGVDKREDSRIEEGKKDQESDLSTTTMNSSFKENDKGSKKLTLNMKIAPNGNNNNQGKRKTKVDWTPELHRRFVQAVEQLGVDKAVPSRILQLMGIDCLTRHNIASHLQKYRSHRKHLLAREAEAASWTHKRQMYGVALAGGKGGTNLSPWHSPTFGFPPVTAMHHPFRPFHVWGHPTMDPVARISMWPKQVVPSPSPPQPAWTTPPIQPPPTDPSFWHSPLQRVPSALTPAVPCFAQPLPSTRFATTSVPGIPSYTIYKLEHDIVPPPPAKFGPHFHFDFYPSKESIDAAIGGILAKPWMPLPIGLKPPSMDSVLVELQRQGISKIPPSCA